MSLQSFPIVGLTKGLQTNVKPAMLPDQAWAILENAYTWRERELKREGKKFLGRLRRIILNNIGASSASPWSFNLFAIVTPPITEPQAEIQATTLNISIGPILFTDNGNGTLTSVTPGNSGIVNYITGDITLTHTAGAGINSSVAFYYFPTLPVMGITQRDIPTLNVQQTIWFDTTYAYTWSGTAFQEFLPGTTWNGTDSDLFWAFNYRGSAPDVRLLFVTNDVVTAQNPVRYTDGTTWTTFAPLITATDTLFQGRIILAYYGRLLMLNTWEGSTAGGYGTATNFFNRCRFSEYNASPVVADAWRSDIFGRGGFLDAPTNEQIIGAIFIKNTLVVDFERSTWQLRYVGEYGLPFIWERISSDFGSDSTFSGVLFDNYRIAVGDKAITQANGVGVSRIDLDIPDQVFDFKNASGGVERITGIRDYKRELIFWNYADAQTNNDIIFPNKVLLYNYRNNTWAIFRDSITTFGNFQSSSNITWDSLDTIWDDEGVLWDDADLQSLFPLIVCGDQQGFVSCYGYDSPSQVSAINAKDQETLTIQAINLTVSPIIITSVNHGLENFDTIYIYRLNFLNNSTFVPISTDLNDKIYRVTYLTADTFSISKWDAVTQQYDDNFAYTPSSAVALYVGGGQIALFPKMNLLSKDINIFQSKSLQTKLSRLDFLLEAVAGGQISVKLYLNSSASGSTPGTVGDLNLVWKGKMAIDALPPFYTPGSDYSWFRYYATLAAQYFSINITYDNDQMNTLSTHSQNCTLYAINAWCRPGGKNVY